MAEKDIKKIENITKYEDRAYKSKKQTKSTIKKSKKNYTNKVIAEVEGKTLVIHVGFKTIDSSTIAKFDDRL